VKGGEALPAGIRVLIVEDYPVFQEGLALTLASQPDISVVAAVANANDAIAEFRPNRPDITLMDQRLPGSIGTDALVTIRAEFPQARVITLTTSKGDIDIQRSIEAGRLPTCSRVRQRKSYCIS
jgi:DNA-binding NarL/FixJ family response regulator